MKHFIAGWRFAWEYWGPANFFFLAMALLCVAWGFSSNALTGWIEVALLVTIPNITAYLLGRVEG